MPQGGNLKPFEKGHKKMGGRKPGVPNKFTRDVREAILAAANNLGFDTKGHGGLVGFFMKVGIKYPQTLATQLGRILPLPEKPSSDKFWNFKLLTDDELRQFERLAMKIEIRRPPDEDDTEADLQRSDSDPRYSQSLLDVVKRKLIEASDSNGKAVPKDREN